MLGEKELTFIADIIDVIYGEESGLKRFESALAITAEYFCLSSVWINLWEGNKTKLVSSYGLPAEVRALEETPHKSCQTYELLRRGKKSSKLYKIENCIYLPQDSRKCFKALYHLSVPLVAGKNVIGTLNMGMEKKEKFNDKLLNLVTKIFSSALANWFYQSCLEEQKNLLMKRNKDMEVFVSAISHDMKTPIIAVKGFLNLIDKKYKDSVPKGMTKYLGQVAKGVDRIEELVKDLLNLSRVEKVLTKQEEIQIEEVLQASLRSIRPLIRHRKPKIKIMGEKPLIMGNWLAFFQIFTNLIANAIKYTPDDRKPEVKVLIKKEKGGWCFCVSDNGIGLTEKEMEKVFEPFTKVKTLAREGSGVGLSIVKRLVEGLGGKIWLESRKNVGTAFYVQIPFVCNRNAEGETRTRTGLTPLDPEPSVSANSTTSAS